jgi:hypothetical protein
MDIGLWMPDAALTTYPLGLLGGIVVPRAAQPMAVRVEGAALGILAAFQTLGRVLTGTAA